MKTYNALAIFALIFVLNGCVGGSRDLSKVSLSELDAAMQHGQQVFNTVSRPESENAYKIWNITKELLQLLKKDNSLNTVDSLQNMSKK